MRRPSNYSQHTAAVADYLADREGLAGTARATFLHIMHQMLGLQADSPRWVAMGLVLLAIGVACFGLAVELWPGSNASTMALWFAVAMPGAALAAILMRAQRQAPPLDGEIEWRVYCWLIRPVILVEKPGLLDRNHPADRGMAEAMNIRPTEVLGAMLRERRATFWGSAALGWSVGVLVLIACRLLWPANPWVFALPLLGMVLAPFIWWIGRICAFRRVARTAHSLR